MKAKTFCLRKATIFSLDFRSQSINKEPPGVLSTPEYVQVKTCLMCELLFQYCSTPYYNMCISSTWTIRVSDDPSGVVRVTPIEFYIAATYITFRFRQCFQL